MLYILFAASKHHTEPNRMRQHSLPIHRYKAIKTWMRERTYSTTIFVMWLKSMEDRTENTVPFKRSSQDLYNYLVHATKHLWFSNNSKKLYSVTVEDILPHSKQHFVAKYSGISQDIKYPENPKSSCISGLDSQGPEHLTVYPSTTILAHSTKFSHSLSFGAHRYNRIR